MTLILRAVSLNDRALTQPITASFGDEGGSIGRSDHNTLALPDPERHISRQQAEIKLEGNRYVIRNVGVANPIIVRGEALAHGESAALAHHDQLRIGGYALEVIAADHTEGDLGRTIASGRGAGEPRTPSGSRRAAGLQGSGPGESPFGAATPGFGDLGTPLSSSNPFADLLGDPTPARARQSQPASSRAAAPVQSRMTVDPPDRLLDPFADLRPPAAGVAAGSAAWAPPAPAAEGGAQLPDDFDPFAPAPAPVAPPTAARSLGSGFEDLIPGAPSVSIDSLIDLPTDGRNPLAEFIDAAACADPSVDMGPAGTSLDPMARFDPPAARHRAASVPTHADHVPELHAAFVPPAIRALAVPPVAGAVRESPRPTPAASVLPAEAVAAAPGAAAASQAAPVQADVLPGRSTTPSPAPWRGDSRELWAAFCAGAGIAIERPQGIDPALMQELGRVLAAAVDGTMKLMAVRATAKHELRAQVTVIQPRNNNPLKFSPDACAALEQLLKPPLRGFLAGPAAMTDAMHDLVGHTIGTMAGTRAALEGVLDRFIPAQLEAKLADPTMLDNLLPMNRKAKLWELYLRHFEAIRNEAHEDFHTLFGRAFLAAYEQQLDRLSGAANSPDPASR